MKLTVPECLLTLHELELSVFLGWSDAENQTPQRVSVDIQIKFPAPPRACQSDDLQDTVTYDALVALMQEKTATRKFRLLEHLCYEIHQLLKTQLPHQTAVSVAVKKYPAIPALKGGASFYFAE
jgi:dihydroneopterin aldolase